MDYEEPSDLRSALGRLSQHVTEKILQGNLWVQGGIWVCTLSQPGSDIYVGQWSAGSPTQAVEAAIAGSQDWPSLPDTVWSRSRLYGRIDEHDWDLTGEDGRTYKMVKRHFDPVCGPPEEDVLYNYATLFRN